MPRSILTYVPLLIVSIIAYIFQGDYLTFILLLFMVSLPILLFLHLRITTRKAEVSLSDDTTTMPRGETLDVPLLVKNLMLISPKLISVEILLTGGTPIETTKHRTIANLTFKDENQILLKLTSEHCGVAKLQVEKVRIYDFMGLFYRTIKCSNECEVTFLPHTFPVSGEISPISHTDMDSNRFSIHVSGNDPTEIFELRDYRDGDSQKKIHWKLSSKMEEYIVKEYSMPLKNKIMLLLQPVPIEKDLEEALVYSDTLLDCIVSLSNFLLTSDIPQAICFVRDGQFIERDIENHYDLAKVTKELVEKNDTVVDKEKQTDLFLESITNPSVSILVFTAEENPTRLFAEHFGLLLFHVQKFSRFDTMNKKYVENIITVKPGWVPEALSNLSL